MNKPKVLFLDIETAPIEALLWGLYDQNLGIEQIQKDWSVLSWAAKWQGEKRIIQMDTRDGRNVRKDKRIIKAIWKLLNEADIIVTQNGKKFDQKKLNARFILHGMQPPKAFKHIDIYVLVKKYFGFTSNKLEYMAKILKVKHKKLVAREFNGFSLWTECLKGNKRAWKEMALYNKQDVLALEDCYNKIAPWGTGVNFGLYNHGITCSCGSTRIKKNGEYVTTSAVYQSYRCNQCGKRLKGNKAIRTIKLTEAK